MPETTRVGRAAFYSDPPELASDGIVDLGDPLERAAVALHAFTGLTPEDVSGLFARERHGGGEELCARWTGPGILESDRKLYRRRAELIVDLYARPS